MTTAPARLAGNGPRRFLSNGKKLTGRPPSRAYRAHSKATDISTFCLSHRLGRLRMFLRIRPEASGIPLAVLIPVCGS